VIGNMVHVQIHLAVNMEGCLVGCLDVRSVIQVNERELLPVFFIKVIRYQKRNKKVDKTYRNNPGQYGIRKF
jgi:hypothetical protein